MPVDKWLSVAGGFMCGAVLWACAEPKEVAANDGDCSCDGATVAALEARIAELEATTVRHDNGVVAIATPDGFPEEGGEVRFGAASDYGVTYYADVFHDAFRVVRDPGDGTGGVAFGWDGDTQSFIVYGDISVAGTVRATGFEPQ
jgi:hypothetical protein